MKLGKNGFTIIEVVVVLPTMIMLTAAMLTIIFNMFMSLGEASAETSLKVEAQTILLAIQDDLQYADGYLSSISSDLSDSFSANYTGLTSANRLIISSPASTSNRRSETRQPVYKNTIGCAAATLDNNPPAYDNLIYFGSGSNLFKRTLVLPSAVATCGTNFLKQSCPSTEALSAACPDYDKRLTDKLSSLNITYYDSSGNTVTNPVLGTYLRFTITLTDRVNAEDITETQSLTVKRLN